MRESIETEIVDPDEAPNKFVVLYLNGTERAVIPWQEAEAIAETVQEASDGDEP